MSQWLMFSAEAQMSEKPFSDGLPEAFRRASGCFFEKSSIPEPIFRAENCGNKKIRLSLHPQQGGLAQLARALAWHARGHEFESRILHFDPKTKRGQTTTNPAKSRFCGISVFQCMFPVLSAAPGTNGTKASVPASTRNISDNSAEKPRRQPKTTKRNIRPSARDGRICATLPKGVICPGKKP